MFACLLAGITACPLLFAQKPPASPFRGVETGVSRLYFQSARELFDAGKPSEAESLVRIAIEYDPESSDAHYLLGRILLTDQGRTCECESELTKAVHLDSFHTYLRTDCALDLAGVFLRTDRFEAGVDLLHRYGMPPYPDVVPFHERPARVGFGAPYSSNTGPGSEAATSEQVLSGRDDPRYAEMLVRLLEGSGESAQARAILEDARARFPNDPGLAYLDLMQDPVPSLATSAWLDDHSSKNPAYLRFVLDYVRILSDDAVRKHFLDLYFRMGGNSPEAWAYSAGLSGNDADALKNFLSAGGLPASSSGTGEIGAVRLIDRRLTDPAAKADLRNRLQNYTGTLGLDSNHDGFFEESLSFDKGRLRSWVVDQDQDGVPEYRLHFTPGLSSVDRSLTTNSAGEPPVTTSYTATYGVYPAVQSVRFERSSLYPGEDVEYQLLPGRLSLPVITPPALESGYDVLNTPELDPTPTLVGESEVRSLAFRAIFRTGNPVHIHRIVFMKDGVPFLAAIDNAGSGVVDEVVEYRNGVPAAGVRDLNGDGYFEESELYTAGRVSYIAVDENHDGMPDYFQQLSPAVTYSWDLNHDGRVDVKDMVIGRNEVTRMFSTQLNGTLDLAVHTSRFLLPAPGGKVP